MKINVYRGNINKDGTLRPEVAEVLDNDFEKGETPERRVKAKTLDERIGEYLFCYNYALRQTVWQIVCYLNRKEETNEILEKKPDKKEDKGTGVSSWPGSIKPAR